MSKAALIILLILGSGCAARLTSRYAKVAIYGNKQKLTELNSLGLPLDHITHYPDSAVIGYFSYYDLRKVKRSGFRYKIMKKNVGKNYTPD